jgi:hypothetical protein
MITMVTEVGVEAEVKVPGKIAVGDLMKIIMVIAMWKVIVKARKIIVNPNVGLRALLVVPVPRENVVVLANEDLLAAPVWMAVLDEMENVVLVDLLVVLVPKENVVVLDLRVPWDALAKTVDQAAKVPKENVAVLDLKETVAIVDLVDLKETVDVLDLVVLLEKMVVMVKMVAKDLLVRMVAKGLLGKMVVMVKMAARDALEKTGAKDAPDLEGLLEKMVAMEKMAARDAPEKMGVKDVLVNEDHKVVPEKMDDTDLEGLLAVMVKLAVKVPWGLVVLKDPRAALDPREKMDAAVAKDLAVPKVVPVQKDPKVIKVVQVPVGLLVLKVAKGHKENVVVLVLRDYLERAMAVPDLEGNVAQAVI